MHGRAQAESKPWLWVAIGVLVVLLGWLVPNPLPWRSPFEGGGGGPAASQAGRPNLAAGAEVAAHTNRRVPPAPTATPTPPPPAGMPAAFKGTWHGHGVNFVGSGNFDTVVTFRASTATSVVATADFPTLGCQEAWQLRTSTPTVLTLKATLAQGLCIQRPLQVQVKLLDAKRIYVQWKLENNVVESEATLTLVT